MKSKVRLRWEIFISSHYKKKVQNIKLQLLEANVTEYKYPRIFA
jgi:hypothetical protein